MNTLNSTEKMPANGRPLSIDIYWNEIKSKEPLSRREEGELFVRVQAGDQQAVERLVEANLRFVVGVAREYCREDGPMLMDLIAEGNMGLLRAIKTFDQTRGFKFITYAVWWIRQAMRKTLQVWRKAARLPASHINDWHRLEKETALLSQELGRTPTFEEIAERASLGTERLHNALEASLSDLSLDAPLFDDEQVPMLALFPAEGSSEVEVEEEALRQALQESLGILSDRELLVVQAYFGLNGAETKTLEQIGQELGVTRERVRQLRNRALGKMRTQFGDLLLELSAN